MRLTSVLLAFGAAALLSGCELFDLDSGEKLAALREADGKAVGSACRHAGRAIEDCYLLNPKALRPAVFAGWLEMDGYMRDNKLEAVAPVLARPVGASTEAAPPPPPDAAVPTEKPAPAKGKAVTS